MSWFNNRRIFSKLMMLVAFMGAIIVVIGVMGIHSLKTLDSKADDMEESAKEALLASGLMTNILMADQLKMHIAADPSPKTVSEAIKVLEEEKKSFEDRISALEKTADAQQKTMLEEIKTNYEQYLTALGETASVASSIKDFTLSEEQSKVKEAAHRSDDESAALNKSVTEFSDDSSKNVSRLSDDITSVYENISRLMVIILTAGVIAGSVIGFLLAKFGIARPIAAIVGILQQLAAGSFDINITGDNRKDEVGDIARTAKVFKENGLEKLRLEAQQKENEKRAAEEKRAMMHKLADDFESGVQGIIAMVASASTELYQTAEGMKKTVTDVSSQSSTAATASRQTSGNVQSVASAVEEMSASIKEIASQVHKSSTVVSEAVNKAAHADKIVHTLSEAMVQIGTISEMIQNITGQINLLALNATIESARAGDAGKGFAVVASEVKNLASQTSKATEEISKQIENVKTVSQGVVDSLKDIQGAINNVNQYSSGIASAVEEQSAATLEITNNMQQAAKGVENINTNITLITKGASDADNGAKEVLSAAQMLSQQSEQLNQEVKKFISGVRG